jgi:hypothetical protein
VTTEPRDLAALFRECAAGRREYVQNAPDDTREVLEVEAQTLVGERWTCRRCKREQSARHRAQRRRRLAAPGEVDGG